MRFGFFDLYAIHRLMGRSVRESLRLAVRYRGWLPPSMRQPHRVVGR